MEMNDFHLVLMIAFWREDHGGSVFFFSVDLRVGIHNLINRGRESLTVLEGGIFFSSKFFCVLRVERGYDLQ